jgi:hypothetical protein
MAQKMLKIVPKRGLIGFFEIGESICKVLTLIQFNIQIFGKIEIISSKADSKQPICIILPDSGKSMFLSFMYHIAQQCIHYFPSISVTYLCICIGFKLRFDATYQKLELIEIYLTSDQSKRRMQFILKDYMINSIKSTQTSFNNINNLMGPTFPAKILNNNALLSYEGISFVF